jgi:hypothetical protein
MIGTLSRPRAENGERGMPAAPLRISAVSSRRPRLMIGSLVLLVACMALFVSSYAKASHQVAVLAVAKIVAPGAVITPDDLTVVHISATGPIAPIAATDANQVVGRRAAVGLVPGGLLTPSDLSRATAVPAGDAVVGVQAKSSQLPAEGVSPGETVDVVLTGIPGAPAIAAATPVGGQSGGVSQASGPVGAVLAPQVTVVAVGPGPSASSDATVVSLVVPIAVAPLIATASAAGQVALVAVSPASAPASVPAGAEAGSQLGTPTPAGSLPPAP